MTMAPAHRRVLRLLASAAVIGVVGASLLTAGGSVAASTGPTTPVTIQTMDSCERALGSAQYLLTGGAGVSVVATTPAHSAQTVASGTCALQQGNCASFTTGCAQFLAVPYPGSYTFTETVTPPGNTSNPEGYAPCNGGSACRSERGAVTIDAAGTVTATVLNVYPDGTSVTYPIASRHSGRPSYAATAADPIVTHDFGLAPPGYKGAGQCDGDSDADDHSTGSPSSHCAYLPESSEASACQPYPWSCAFTTSTSSTTSAGTSSSSSSTTTSTSTTTTTTTTTTASTTTTSSSSSSTAPGCTTQTFTGSASSSATTSNYVLTSAAGPLTATVTWSPTAVVTLIVYDSSLTELGRSAASSSQPLSVSLANVAAGRYKVKVKDSSSAAVTFAVSVNHC